MEVIGMIEEKSTTRQWAEAVLDQALALEEGDQLAFQMESERQLNSYRIQLSRARDRLSAMIGADALAINIQSKGRVLILSKSGTIPLQGTIFKKSGEVELAPPIKLQVVPIPRPTDIQDISEEEMLRRRELLKAATEDLHD
jgi:hypothetical protein